MIEKSLYENYQIAFSDNLKPDFEDYLFVFNENRELFLTPKKELPKTLDEFDIEFCLFIGKYNSKNCFVVNADFKNGYDLREVYEFNHDLYHIAGKAVLVRDWYISHRFCGRCGTKTQLDEKDMMLKCPSCGQVHYPRIAPAIIVAIRKDDELLMAKHSYHDNIRYALIAGFVEPGESIEEAVHREVLEEVGIKIKNLRYFGSQPWPYPCGIMVGFNADYESGEIHLQEEEIAKGAWFKADNLPTIPEKLSIARMLLDDWLNS